MSASGPSLRTTTLALLYWAQGHDAKARETLDQILRERPDDGEAQAVLERMSGIRGTIDAAIDGNRLRVHCQCSSGPAHAVVGFWTLADKSPRFSSHRVSNLQTVEFALPRGPASATVCLLFDTNPGMQIIAVGEPISW